MRFPHLRSTSAVLAGLGLLSSEDTPEGRRQDANETVAFSRSLEHVKAQILDAEFPDLRARDFIPPETDTDPNADFFTWRQYTREGVAKIVANYATDVPMIDEFGEEATSPIRSVAAGFQYSTQDLRRSRKLGYQLESRRGIGAREAAERLIDRILALGDTTRNLPGFLNTSGIPSVTGLNTNWSTTATAAEILEDLNTIAFFVWNQSKQKHAPDTMILPTNLYQIAAATPYSANDSEPVLSVFKRTNPFIKTVESWLWCDAANNTAHGLNVDRVVCYQKRPENMAYVVPIDYQTMPPQQEGLAFKVPAEARVGGTIIYRPLAMAYADGLLT